MTCGPEVARQCVRAHRQSAMWSQAEYLGTAAVTVTELAANRLAESVLAALCPPSTPSRWWVAFDRSGFRARGPSSELRLPLATLLVCDLVFEDPHIVVWVVTTARGRLEASVWRCARKEHAVRLFQLFHELTGKPRLERLASLTPRPAGKENAVATATVVVTPESQAVPKPPPRLKKKKKAPAMLPSSPEELLEGVSEVKKDLILKLLSPGGRPTPEKPPAESRQREPAGVSPPPPPPPPSPPPSPEPARRAEFPRAVALGGRRVALSTYNGETGRVVVRKPSVRSSQQHHHQSRLIRSYHAVVPNRQRSGSLTSRGSSSEEGTPAPRPPKSALKKAKLPPQKKNVTFNAYTRVQVMDE